MADDNQALLLQVSADVSKLEKAFAKASGTVDQHSSFMERRAKQLGKNVEDSLGNVNVGKSLTDVFNASRLTVLEEGGARLRIFGSALEPLGPLGIAAAAGVVAFGLAMDRTDKAIDAAANIAKLGKEVGVSTDFIQTFNFAARQTDIDVGSADEAIKALNVSLGAVQAGLAKSQQVKAFAAVGFTPEQLRQFHDVGDFLPVLADRIAALGNASEQAAVARRLGVLELLPLLKQGAAGFNALTQEARDLGIVLDADLIQKAEEAKKKLSEIADITKAKTTATFAEFADTLIAVKNAFAQAELAGLKFLASLTNTTPAAEQLKTLRAHVAELEQEGKAPGSPGSDRSSVGIRDKARIDFLNAKINQIEIGEINKQLKAADAAPSAASTAARQLVPDKAKTAKADRTQASIDAALAKEDQAHAALLQALLAQASDLDVQLGLVRQITQAEKDRVDAETAKKIAEVAAAKDIKTSAKAGIEAAYRKAAEDEKAAIDAKAIRETLDLQLKTARTIVDHQAAQMEAAAGILDSQAQLATTLKERAALEAASLKLRQQAELDRANQGLAEAFAKGDVGGTLRAADDIGSIKARQAQDSKALAAQNAGPIADYLRSVQDLDTEFETAGVRAIQSLSSGLADAIVNAHSLGDVARNVFRQMIADVLQAVLNKQITSAVAAFLPGFADGTDFAPGGLAVVGERGKEVVNLPRGAQVIPNHSLSALANVGAPQGAKVTILQPITADFRGAVVTEDLMASFKQYADSVGARAAIAGAQLGKTQALGAIQSATANRLGRR